MWEVYHAIRARLTGERVSVDLLGGGEIATVVDPIFRGLLAEFVLLRATPRSHSQSIQPSLDI